MHTACRATLPRVGAGILWLGLVFVAAGCSGKGTISGKIYYKDQPLGGGQVIFTNADGKGTLKADIQPDGSYTIERMPSGLAKIAVDTSSLRPVPQAARNAPHIPAGPPPDQVPPGVDVGKTIYGATRPQGQKYVPIPENYSDPEKSGKTYTVTGGSQQYDIRLESASLPRERGEFGRPRAKLPPLTREARQSQGTRCPGATPMAGSDPVHATTRPADWAGGSRRRRPRRPNLGSAGRSRCRSTTCRIPVVRRGG